MKLIRKEDILEFTKEYEGERFPDGRPCVPDDIIERMKKVTIEEAWGVLQGQGYRFQFAGDWVNLHPDRVLVGRAVTCAFVPLRPDFQSVVEAQGKADERIGGQNSWVIDTLVENDTIVVDLFGKVKDGTFAGDNLGNAIFARSKTGMVIDGGIRDLQRILPIPDFCTYVRRIHPEGIPGVTMPEINGVTRIDAATCIPGDVVLGTAEGVVFIPPHLAAQVAESGG